MGCFCNSGSCQRSFNLSNEEMKRRYEEGHNCGDEMDIIDGQPTGALRVSFGYYNTFKDVDKLISMINQCYIQSKIPSNVSAKQNGVISNGTAIIRKSIYNESDITISEIAIYPIEFCAAFKIIVNWKINKIGFEYDNEWRIVKDGIALTRKQKPLMSEIYPIIDLTNRCLTLHFEGVTSISVTLDTTLLTYCKTTDDYDCGDKVSEWLSKALNEPNLRLRKKCVHTNPLKGKSAGIILINKTTLQWLKYNRKLTFDDTSLRGNIIIETPKELKEEKWKNVIIGGHEFKVERHCYKHCQEINRTMYSSKYTENADMFFYGLNLSYIKPISDFENGYLGLNSKIIPNLNDDIITYNYKEVCNDTVKDGTEEKKYNNKFTMLTKYLRRHSKKYEVTVK